MAVGTGFGQLFQGIGKGLTLRGSQIFWLSFVLSGQVGGVAISSAIFQSSLEGELRNRIHRPDAEDVRDPDIFYFSQVLIVYLLVQLIKRIRQSARLITSLPPDLQRIARDSYSASLKSVFFFAACSTMLAYLVRLPVCRCYFSHLSQGNILLYFPIHATLNVYEPSYFADPRQSPRASSSWDCTRWRIIVSSIPAIRRRIGKLHYPWRES